jgi:hypothetical protein
MTEPKDLLLVNEQLRRSNRRWKTACFALIILVVSVLLLESRLRVKARAVLQMKEAAHAAFAANQAEEAGQPR